MSNSQNLEVLELQSTIATVRQQAAAAGRSAWQAQKALNALIEVGCDVYKQVITAQPALADAPRWVLFRTLLGIPEGALDRPDPAVTDEDKFEQEGTVLAGRLQALTQFVSVTPEKRAAIVQALRNTLANLE
jgi:hypothetical protein